MSTPDSPATASSPSAVSIGNVVTASSVSQPFETDAATAWAVDYVDGDARPVTGEPFRIGFASGTTNDIDAAAAAVAFLNGELGGVGGRPLELEVCDASSTPTLEEQSAFLLPCGERLAADPTIELLLVGDLFTLDTSFTDLVGASKAVYVSYGYQNVGVSYNPNGVETLAAAAHFIANELAPRFDRLIAIDPVAVSQFIRSVLPDLPIVDVPFDQFKATTVEQAVSLIAATGAGSDDIFFVQAPECQQVVDAFHQLSISPTVVAGGGCTDEALDGWYKVNLGWNPSDPDLETGALVASRELIRRGVDTSGITTFADVLTMAKIINGVGADEATPDRLRDALYNFNGVAMLAVGPSNCADPIVLDVPLGNCATAVDVYQMRNGAWVALTAIPL